MASEKDQEDGLDWSCEKSSLDNTSPLCSKQYAYLFNKPPFKTHATIYKRWLVSAYSQAIIRLMHYLGHLKNYTIIHSIVFFKCSKQSIGLMKAWIQAETNHVSILLNVLCMTVYWTHTRFICLKNEVWPRAKQERNILHTIKRRKANWIGHILQNIDTSDGKTRKKRYAATGWPEGIERILEIEKGSTSFHTVGTRCGRGYEPVVRQTKEFISIRTYDPVITIVSSCVYNNQH